jgi:V-type H+-transporting ATPase 16kDa proteolipid subunit
MAGFSGDETAPFFGFLGAAAALIFSCKPQLILNHVN